MRLRALDPHADIELFHEAYNWRNSPKPHTSNGRMAFERFASDSPDCVVMGLFNGDLCAVYMFIETAPKVFEAHFTARRGTDPAIVLAGARTMVDWFHSQGAVVTAEIVARNGPVRTFAETLGFTLQDCACQDVESGSKLTTVKYLSRMEHNNLSDAPPVST